MELRPGQPELRLEHPRLPLADRKDAVDAVHGFPAAQSRDKGLIVRVLNPVYVRARTQVCMKRLPVALRDQDVRLFRGRETGEFGDRQITHAVALLRPAA